MLKTRYNTGDTALYLFQFRGGNRVTVPVTITEYCGNGIYGVMNQKGVKFAALIEELGQCAV